MFQLQSLSTINTLPVLQIVIFLAAFTYRTWNCQLGTVSVWSLLEKWDKRKSLIGCSHQKQSIKVLILPVCALILVIVFA